MQREVHVSTHESFGATECREMTGTNGDESVWCEAKLMKNYKLLIGCIYRSPNSNVTNDAKIIDTLKKANNLGFSHVLIFGDLNHPSLNWRENTSPPDGNHPSTIFMEAVRESFLTQHVTEPTHYRGNNTPNTLDIHQRRWHDRETQVPGTNRKETPLTTEFQLLLLHQVHQI